MHVQIFLALRGKPEGVDAGAMISQIWGLAIQIYQIDSWDVDLFTHIDL